MAKFLVVDDEADNVRALENLLREDGHEVLGFTNGIHAVEAISKDSFDAVITDFEMPHVTGDIVVQAARKHHPTACIFVCSGKPGLSAVDHACHVFNKPLDYDRLAQTVAECRATDGVGLLHRCYHKPPEPGTG